MSNMPVTPRQQRGAHAAPMSERQQMALLMQMCSQHKSPTPPINPGEERRRTRQQRNERGETPLHIAAKKGDQEQVQRLLDQGTSPDVTDFAGWTPLHEACSYGWYHVVQTLVQAGADVNARGLDNDTPLHDAAATGNLQMVKFLVEHGADPCAKNNAGKMPSHFSSQSIYDYLLSVKETAATVRPTHARARDDNKKSNAPVADAKRTMDNLAASDTFENKEGPSTDKPADNKDESHSQLSSAVVSSTQDEGGASSARTLFDADMADASDDEAGRRKKKKEELPKETVKSTQPPRGTAARVLAGTKPPGPASKTGAVPLGKNSQGASAAKPTATGPAAGKNNVGPVKTGAVTQGKTAGTNKGSVSAAVTPSKGPERKSPDDTPKPNPTKELMEVDSEETKAQESSSPKVPPLKIVIPGGVVVGVGSAGTQQEGDPRPAGKGRGSAATLPYVMPCSTEGGADSNDDDKKTAEEKRILRSHRTTDDKDKEDRSPPPASGVTTPPATAVSAADLVPPSRVVPTTQEETLATPTVTTTAVATSANGSSSWSGSTSSNELHPRKRKIRASKESHSKEPAADVATSDPPVQHHSNPYQQYIDIRRQIERRQKSLFPVQPKPPQGFKDYLMNRGTYLLQKNIKPMPPVNPPATLPAQMRDQYCKHEKDRHHLKIQHIIEKEKLVLSVEQEILRVHGRAARALANQALPFSACTILRDKEVYNAITPEQEEKERNAQRSRYNGRLFLSWLQDVDDKWEKIKEGMVRRHHTEAETLHAVQKMQWEWRLKEFGLCDYKSTPKIEPSHVPQVHVSDDFDLLPA